MYLNTPANRLFVLFCAEVRQTRARDAVELGRFCLQKNSSERTPLFFLCTSRSTFHRIQKLLVAYRGLSGSEFWGHSVCSCSFITVRLKKQICYNLQFIWGKQGEPCTRSFSPTYLPVSARNGRNLDGELDLCSASFNLAGMASFFEGFRTASLISFFVFYTCERYTVRVSIWSMYGWTKALFVQFNNFTFLS